MHGQQNVKLCRRLLFGIGRIIMSEASHNIKHSLLYLISRGSFCRHKESPNKAAMQPNLVYRNILITKKMERQIKFFETNSLSLSMFIWMGKLDPEERLHTAGMKSLRAIASYRLLQGTMEL